MEPLLHTPAEAADLLRLSRAKIYELMARGELPSLKIDRSRRIARSDLLQWIADHAVDLT